MHTPAMLAPLHEPLSFVEPAPAAAPAQARHELAGALLRQRHRWLAVALVSGVINLLMLVPTLYMLQVYDRVMISQSELTLLAVSLLTLGLFVVMAGAEALRSRLLLRVSAAIEAALTPRVFAASFAASLNVLSSTGARALNDLTLLRQFVTGPGAFAFFDAPWAPLYIGVLYLLHPALGLMGVVFACIQGLLAWWSQRRSAAGQRAAADAVEAEAAVVRSAAGHAEAVEAMGMGAALHERWETRRRARRGAAGAQHASEQRMAAISRFTRQAQQSLGLGLGALLVINGELSAGAMIAANVLMSRALAPIDTLVGSWRQGLNARDAWRRLSALLADYAPHAASARADLSAPRLTLERACAHVPGRERPVIEPLDLQIEPGTVTVVLGPSGSGKSALLRLLLGIWPGAQGRVLLGGALLADCDREALGRHLGYLPQDVELFDGSIAENIARCAPPDSPAVLAAAQACGLHDLILRLPRGYDTAVGEAGHLLSGGQRQRIALARAVYGETRVLVLDEPNANLDEAGETALTRLVHLQRERGCTVVVASHRPGILAVADRVIVLEAGRIRLDGPRDVVLAALNPQPHAPLATPAATRVVHPATAPAPAITTATTTTTARLPSAAALG
jgi:ATP-binding cassette, subfamily C, bacterial exporter for protease/lipase